MVLRAILQNWLRQTAQDALRQQLASASGDATSAEAIPPCDVAIVFALGMESGGLEDLMPSSRVLRGEGFRAVLGQIEGRNVTLIITGMGSKAARQGTEALIAGHRPRYVVSAGFSGGLHSDLAVGDIVLGQRIVDRQGARVEIPFNADPASMRQKHLHVGGLLNVERLVRLPKDKQALGAEHEALAVDLESLAVAQVCQQEHVPFLAVRIISDDVNEELPEFLDRYASQHSLAGKTGAIIGSLLKQPSNVKSMYKMREQGLVLADRLARFLVTLVRELAPARTDDEPTTHAT